jgi:hypothetical protein
MPTACYRSIFTTSDYRRLLDDHPHHLCLNAPTQGLLEPYTPSEVVKATNSWLRKRPLKILSAQFVNPWFNLRQEYVHSPQTRALSGRTYSIPETLAWGRSVAQREYVYQIVCHQGELKDQSRLYSPPTSLHKSKFAFTETPAFYTDRAWLLNTPLDSNRMQV